MQRAIEGQDSFDDGFQDDQPGMTRSPYGFAISSFLKILVPPSQLAYDTSPERLKSNPSNKPRKSGAPSQLTRPSELFLPL